MHNIKAKGLASVLLANSSLKLTSHHINRRHIYLILNLPLCTHNSRWMSCLISCVWSSPSCKPREVSPPPKKKQKKNRQTNKQTNKQTIWNYVPYRVLCTIPFGLFLTYLSFTLASYFNSWRHLICLRITGECRISQTTSQVYERIQTCSCKPSDDMSSITLPIIEY